MVQTANPGQTPLILEQICGSRCFRPDDDIQAVAGERLAQAFIFFETELTEPFIPLDIGVDVALHNADTNVPPRRIAGGRWDDEQAVNQRKKYGQQKEPCCREQQFSFCPV